MSSRVCGAMWVGARAHREARRRWGKRVGYKKPPCVARGGFLCAVWGVAQALETPVWEKMYL